jgi:hypothetical protein
MAESDQNGDEYEISTPSLSYGLEAASTRSGTGTRVSRGQAGGRRRPSAIDSARARLDKSLNRYTADTTLTLDVRNSILANAATLPQFIYMNPDILAAAFVLARRMGQYDTSAFTARFREILPILNRSSTSTTSTREGETRLRGEELAQKLRESVFRYLRVLADNGFFEF